MAGILDFANMVQQLGLLQNVGDVIPFQRRNPDFKMQTEMGARPYQGGGPNILPPEVRISDIPGFGGRPLRGHEIAADQAANQALRQAAARLRATIKDPKQLEAATDQLFSASIRPNPQYEIAVTLNRLLGPKR